MSLTQYRHYVLVDTGAWYALFDKDDNNHVRANNIYINNSKPLITTYFVFDELMTLTKKRLGHAKAVAIGKSLWNRVIADLISLTEEDKAAAWKIFQRYNDNGFSFTDCTTFSVMERLNISTAFTFDEHFNQYHKIRILC